MQHYIGFLETLCAFLAVTTALALTIALLAWRWRPLPVDQAKLHPWEQRLLKAIEGNTN